MPPSTLLYYRLDCLDTYYTQPRVSKYIWSLVTVAQTNCVGSPKIFVAIEGPLTHWESRNAQRNAGGHKRRKLLLDAQLERFVSHIALHVYGWVGKDGVVTPF
jgi:hypothetical protein